MAKRRKRTKRRTAKRKTRAKKKVRRTVGRKRKGRKKSQMHQTMVKRHNPSLDRKRKAKKPGKRVSKSGKVYYEYRINRSDMSRREKY